MTDIVERLRDPSKGSPRWADTMAEAADEIERLRADVARCEASLLAWVDAVGECNKDRDRLRSGLEKIAAMRPPIPVDAEGDGPNWEQYIYTRTWALFAANLQNEARAALEGNP